MNQLVKVRGCFFRGGGPIGNVLLPYTSALILLFETQIFLFFGTQFFIFLRLGFYFLEFRFLLFGPLFLLLVSLGFIYMKCLHNRGYFSSFSAHFSPYFGLLGFRWFKILSVR